MKTVLKAQFAKDKRNPLLLLLFIAGSILANLLFGGGVYTPTTVAIFSEEANAADIELKWERLLNADQSMRFVVVSPDEARDNIRKGNADVAVKLMERDYRLVVTNEHPGVSYVRQHVERVFQREARISAMTAREGGEGARDAIERDLSSPPLQLKVQGLDSEEIPGYNMRTQLLFAFTFLIAMFIIGLKVNNVTNDKVAGIWNRMILSPIRKTSMYSGYILYSFLITLFQIALVLLLFKYAMKYELGDQFWLVIVIAAFFTFSMISVAMLITGFVKTPEQFYAIYPSLITLIPLVSGAYMMPGAISNPVFLFIADLFPMAHAMDAVSSVIFHHAGLQDVAMPLMYMLLIGVVAMGLGINLMERRSH